MSIISQTNIKQFIIEQEIYGSRWFENIKKNTPELVENMLAQGGLSRDNFILVVTGSDGRLENRRNASSVEMIAYTNKDVCKLKLHEIASQMGAVMTGYNYHSLAEKTYGHNNVEIESKYFNNISIFEDPYSNYRCLFPPRFLDSRVVYGSQENKYSLNEIFYQEIRKTPSTVIDQFKSRVKYAQDIAIHGDRTFKDIPVKHFDLAKGEIYYQKNSVVEKGIKMGPLRLIQYKLSFLIVQLIRKGLISNEDLAQINGFTVDKINFLESHIGNLIGSSWGDDLNIIYYTCLKIHHICQKKFKNVENNSQEVKFLLNEDEKKIIQEMLDALPLILKDLKV